MLGERTENGEKLMLEVSGVGEEEPTAGQSERQARQYYIGARTMWGPDH